MTRQHVTFACESETLVASLDKAGGTSGLLVVSGGNGIRSGAFSGQARIAALIAEAGHPVFRFDRRGVGDSSGENEGFRGGSEDIAAALREFRHLCPQLHLVVAFGNCDAASALMLQGGAGCGALVLANPWTFESDDAPLPAAAIRTRYADKLRNPRELARLVRGQVSWRKLVRGLFSAFRPEQDAAALALAMRSGIAEFAGPVQFLLAGRDRTAQAFRACWPADDPRVAVREGADHAFSADEDREWLVARLLEALQEQAGELDMRGPAELPDRA